MRIERLLPATAIAAVVALTACGHGSTPPTTASLLQHGGAAGTSKTMQSARNGAAEPVVGNTAAAHTVYMVAVPAQAPGVLTGRSRPLPLLVGTDPATWMQHKFAAAQNASAPIDLSPLSEDADTAGIAPPATTPNFDGLADSSTICPPTGCTPPDMALAVSPTAVLQFVNTSMAVYTPEGKMQAGFPKQAAAFFRIPSPGACSSVPFTSDPRAIYDTKDGRFWITILEVEGAFGVNSCPLKSVYWVAVSKSSDPNGAWNVYSFDMRDGGNVAADFTQTGLDGQAFYMGGNMFDPGGNGFLYDEIFALSKAKMEAGQPVTPRGFKNITVNGTLVDTLQPVLVEGSSSPPAGLFVDTYNINSGSGQCFIPCSGINIVALANPLTSPSLSYVTVPSQQYTLAPLAWQPGNPESMETFDTRISATPVYRDGSITFAIESGISNQYSVVPGVMWFQLKPALTGDRVTGGSIVQNGILAFKGHRAVSFGATMTDAAGDMLLVFDSMGPKRYAGIFSAFRKAGDPTGTLRGLSMLKPGASTITSCGLSACRWGDYEAASFDGSRLSRIWFSAEYANPNQDWSTKIGIRSFP